MAGRKASPDGIIDNYDRVPIGKPGCPSLWPGCTRVCATKASTSTWCFRAVTGTSVYLGGNIFQAFQNNGQIGDIALNRWTPQTAATADYPRLSSKNNLNNYQLSSFWQRDGSFIKLRSAEIGYTLPASLSNRININSVRFFCKRYQSLFHR